MQEELKSARNKYTLMREEVEVQRRKVDAKEQETFAAQNMLVDLQEEIDRLKQQNKVVEGQRDALKTALKGEEVARIAAEGAISLPRNLDDDEFASPKMKGRHQHRESLKENVDPEGVGIEDELMALKEELRMERRVRLRADDQIHFMKMECQFQCCSCRVAERHGMEYVHDGRFVKQMEDVAPNTVGECVPAPTTMLEHKREEVRPSTPPRQPSEQREPSEPLLNFSPATGTFYKADSPQKLTSLEPLLPTSRPTTPPSEPIPQQTPLPSSPIQQTPSFTFPVTPRPLPTLPTRTISHTTTVTIPLKDDDIPFSPAPMTPGGISREEALEQIRQRRGRARSIAAGNGTPRKRMVEMGELRRDISAPGRV